MKWYIVSNDYLINIVSVSNSAIMTSYAGTYKKLREIHIQNQDVHLTVLGKNGKIQIIKVHNLQNNLFAALRLENTSITAFLRL